MTFNTFEEWMDSQEFYELCQTYRHSRDAVPLAPGLLTASEAFEQLKSAIKAVREAWEARVPEGYVVVPREPSIERSLQCEQDDNYPGGRTPPLT